VITLLTVLLASSLFLLLYVYAGYPLLLRAIVALRGVRTVRKAPITPSVTLIISAFNEEEVIAQKIENALALDYPRDRLDIIVISDASDDATDAIVSRFADRRVRLVRQPQRRGKTAGLNRTLATVTSDVVVFSDANAMYQRDALRMLVRNFADPAVGCVTGEARYLTGTRAAADRGERVYWDYEIQIKRLETALGSMVGGDGAIYAIRRSLWRELPEDAINDFLNPLQIVATGWRSVYEPEAVCYEESAGAVHSEYKRRVRIVSRSWRAVFQERRVLNPLRVGLFAWSIVSHKVLRWLSGVFASIAIASGIFLGAHIDSGRVASWVGLVLLALLLMALVPVGRRAIGLLAYFAAINVASVVGVVKGTLGRVSGIWTTPRQPALAPQPAVGVLVPVGRMLLVAGSVLTAAVIAFGLFSSPGFAPLVFWIAAGLLVYVYVGYPVLLAAMRLLQRRPVRRGHIEPRVCLFIAANDEGLVMEAKLENSLAVDYPSDRLDIVVASDGSIDTTNAIVERFAPRVRLLPFFPRRGKITAINDGMGAVDSDIVIFSDANTFLAPDSIRAIVRNFADPEVGAVSGDVALVGERAALGRSEDLYYVYERWLQHAESEVGSMIGADGALYAIRRELFAPAPADTILDDLAIPMAVVRGGYRVVFDPDARAYEYGSESAREEFARKTRVIAGAVQFLIRPDSGVPANRAQVIVSLVSHKGLRWLSPMFASCMFFASIALASTSAEYAMVAIAQGLLVTLGVAGCVPALRRNAIVSLAHYFCLVQAAAVIGFVRGALGRQSVRWRRFAHAGAGESAEAA
jgi:cellulose synthase/poly-beta-1,6-N-acetylglucosamine synthase-like glycosyltransferase